MKQLFSEFRQEAVKDCGPEKRIINDMSPTVALVTITWKPLVGHDTGKDNQAGYNILTELRRQRLEFGEDEVGGICRAEY